MKTTNENTTLPLAAIEPSPTNPRTEFDTERQKQLVETVRTHGIIQNLIVRPWPGRAGAYECVDGHRRLAAAREIGLVEVPVRVMELTTRQVIAIQLVTGENGEPLTALDEARGFQTALTAKEGEQACYTIEALAEQINRSRNYIWERLTLLDLPKRVHDFIRAGALPPRTATLLARIPTPELREKAIDEVVRPQHREEPLTYKETEALIHERYMVSLRHSPPFDPNDATLLGPEGKPLACAKCPLKTGNDPERFADVKDKNVCTSPVCFRAKCATAWERAAAKAKAAGQRVLTDEEAAEVFEKNSPVVQIAFSSPYVDVNSKPTYRHVANEVEDSKLPTWRELLETAEQRQGIKVPIVLARDRTGKQWELVQLTLAVEAARAAGEDMFKKTPVAEALGGAARSERDGVRGAIRGTDDFAQKKKAEADATKRRLAESCTGLVQLHGLLTDRMTGTPSITEALLHVALHHAGIDGQALVVKAFGLKTLGGDFELSDAITAWFKPLPLGGKHAAIPVLLVARDMKWTGLKSEGFVALAEAVGLDIAKVTKEAGAKAAKGGKKNAERSTLNAERPSAGKKNRGAGAKAEAAVRESMNVGKTTIIPARRKKGGAR